MRLADVSIVAYCRSYIFILILHPIILSNLSGRLIQLRNSSCEDLLYASRFMGCVGIERILSWDHPVMQDYQKLSWSRTYNRPLKYQIVFPKKSNLRVINMIKVIKSIE